jgi:hypothetical protein
LHARAAECAECTPSSPVRERERERVRKREREREMERKRERDFSIVQNFFKE